MRFHAQYVKKAGHIFIPIFGEGDLNFRRGKSVAQMYRIFLLPNGSEKYHWFDSKWEINTFYAVFPYNLWQFMT